MNILLLRGLSREQRHWYDFPQKLEMEAKKLSNQVKIFCLDLPGAGTENGKPSPSRIDEISIDTRARWLKLKEQNRAEWHLVSISLGGMVALDWCANHPEDFKTLTVMNTSAKNLGSMFERMKLFVLPKVLRSHFSKDRKLSEKLILDFTSNLRKDKSEIIEKWSKIAQETPPHPSLAWSQIRAGMKFTAPYSIAVSTLVLASDNDRLVSPQCSKRLAKRLTTKIKLHPTAGHDLTLDDPNWVISHLLPFIGLKESHL